MKSTLTNQLTDTKIECGCDEVGRGCIAGPVFAAAVIISEDFGHPLLDDSKKMTPKHRFEVREYIETHAKAWAVASLPAEEIDRINILNASIKAMQLAISFIMDRTDCFQKEHPSFPLQKEPGIGIRSCTGGGTIVRPDLLLIDGNRFHPLEDIEYRCIVKGDAKFTSIAAASVLAKTYRDSYMMELSRTYSGYGWESNMGYPTEKHREAVERLGITPFHRKSFRLTKENTLF